MTERFRVDEDGAFWSGDVCYRWAVVETRDQLFGRVRRARIPLESGWMLSVIWGDATYSDNHVAIYEGQFTETPTTAEVAILDRDGEQVELPDGDTVYGYCRPSVMNALVQFLATVPSLHSAWTEDHFIELSSILML